MIEPFRAAREALTTIPGVSLLVADVIIAETGADMTVFPTSGHLASWTGVCPGSNESAGRIKSTKIMPGNKYLKAALGIAAMSASRSKNTYLSVKYRRIAGRRGRVKAIVALEHAMLTAAWHMLAHGEIYQDPGAEYYLKRDPEQAKAKTIRQLKTLGYEVTLTPAAA
jgi:transposase